MSTTNVVAYTSFRDGHVTRRISLRTSVKKLRLLRHQPTGPPSAPPQAGALTGSSLLLIAASQLPSPNFTSCTRPLWQVRRDSNPQPSVLETDALPIELLTCSRPKAHGLR